MNISQKLEAIAEALDKIGGVMTQIKNEWGDKESPHELGNARELLAEVADVVEGEAWRYRSQTQSYPPDEPEYCLVCGKQEKNDSPATFTFTLTENQALFVIRELLRNSYDWLSNDERWFTVERFYRKMNRQTIILYRLTVKLDMVEEINRFLKQRVPDHERSVHHIWNVLDNPRISVSAVGDAFEARIQAGFTRETPLAVSFSSPNEANLDFFDDDDMAYIRKALDAAWAHTEQVDLDNMLPELYNLAGVANNAYNERLQDVCIREHEARGE